MKVSNRRASFLSIQASGSKPLTSAAIRQAYAAASHREIIPTPLVPSSKADQVSRVPMPQGETRPIPVTTTRRRSLMTFFEAGGGLLLRVLGDIAHSVADRLDLLGVLVADLELELFLERHHELDRVERVRPQVVHELRLGGHLGLIH